MDVDKLKPKYALESTDDSFDLENPSKALAPENSSKKLLKNKCCQSCKSKRYLGHHFPLLWDKSEPILTIGPHWPFFLCMWIVFIVIGVAVTVNVASRQSFVVKILSILITMWQAFIYLYTALKNPGIASAKDSLDSDLDLDEGNPQYYFDLFCSSCKIVKTEDIYHCEDCDVCVKGYDHHCPWTGKCIGSGNIMPFYTFLLSTVVYIVFCILITVNTL